jgi:hypothetical protein
MGANTLTNLIGPLYEALDVVSRELVGFVPSVTRDSNVERAAVGQTVYSFVPPVATMTDIVPSNILPDDGDQVIGSVPLTITKAKRVPFRWNGEQTRGVNNNGPGVQAIKNGQIAQAIRTLCNAMELDMATTAYLGGSRAYGTAGTDPFASTLSDPARVRQILDDNGAPKADRSLVINSSAGAAMRTLAQLTKANESADTSMLRQGTLLDIHGFAIRESGQVVTPAVGTAAGATTNIAGYAVGATSITCAAAGTGTILVGDIITFAGDTNKYVVTSGLASAAAGGTITIAAPGLRVAMSTVAKAITVIATGARNVGFSRNALVLANRLPSLPDGGDMAIDRTTVTDERSGLTFEIAMYAQYRQMQYEISAAWGTACVKPEHVSILLGA